MANADTQAANRGKARTVVLIDPMALRRAAMRAFLDQWTHAGEPVEILDYEGAEVVEAEAVGASAMVILSIGGRHLRDREFAGLREMMLPLASNVPIVLICDHLCQDEIAWAFERGLRGYLPTNTEPGLAISALTFILNGGDFFPPSALAPPDPRHCAEAEQDRENDGAQPGEHKNGPEGRWEHFHSMPPISVHVAAFCRHHDSRMPRRKVAWNGSMI